MDILGQTTLDLTKAKFGSTLLTEYFTFAAPDDQMKKKQFIVADANNFAINSQAALQFYQGDPTVKQVYRRLYHIGWPLQSENVSDGSLSTITGGADQKNRCHVVELMCACAAYDFFTIDETQLGDASHEAEYLYRVVPFSGNNFDFFGSDFVGEKGDVFMNKLGAMFSLSHIILKEHQAAFGHQGIKGLLERFSNQNIKNYDALKPDQADEIDKYFKMFAYDIDNKTGNLIPGWIYQIKNSVGSGKFMFRPEAFPEKSDIKNVDPGNIFVDERHKWDKKFISSRYDFFISKIVVDNRCFPKDSQKVSTVKERFLAHVYNGITIAQKFKV